MRVLVTGGLGFIGSSIVDAYYEAGHIVTACDDLSSNVVRVEDSPAYVHVGDVEDYLRGLSDLPDLIVHCANPVGAAGILRLRGRIASETMRTTSAVAQYCAATCTGLVYMSSSEVYGRSGTYTETDDLRVPAFMTPRIEYAVGKIAAESCVRLTSRLRSIILRPFNVAGARQQSEAGFVLPTFCEQAVMGYPMTVFGDGQQRRCLTGVEDVAAFVLGLQNEHYDGRIVNVGTPENETPIINLACRVRALAGNGSASPINYTDGQTIYGADYAEAEGIVKVPNVEFAESMGWQPVWTLDRLITDALSHVREGAA